MNRPTVLRWAPALLLVLGAVLTLGMDRQRSMSLRAPLDARIPRHFEGGVARDIEISEEERRVAGMSSYVMREYFAPGADPQTAEARFSVYVGYYEQQAQGSTIHSPKNCLPGAGWEALQSERLTLAFGDATVPVNRYLLQRGESRSLVLYWYQGRGRIEANEYIVKANLLRDSALSGRSEEALVRIVVPITDDLESAEAIAVRFASELMTYVSEALPA